MSIDYASIATNSALLATILTPLLQYVNKASQTYFFDLMGLPFAVFLVTTVTSVIDPNDYTVFLFVLSIVLEVVIYGLIVIERYYFEKYGLAPRGRRRWWP